MVELSMPKEAFKERPVKYEVLELGKDKELLKAKHHIGLLVDFDTKGFYGLIARKIVGGRKFKFKLTAFNLGSNPTPEVRIVVQFNWGGKFQTTSEVKIPPLDLSEKIVIEDEEMTASNVGGTWVDYKAKSTEEKVNMYLLFDTKKELIAWYKEPLQSDFYVASASEVSQPILIMLTIALIGVAIAQIILFLR